MMPAYQVVHQGGIGPIYINTTVIRQELQDLNQI